MSDKKPNEYFQERYSKELEIYFEETSDREADCMRSLLEDGMTEKDFLAHVVSIEAAEEFALTMNPEPMKVGSE